VTRVTRRGFIIIAGAAAVGTGAAGVALALRDQDPTAAAAPTSGAAPLEHQHGAPAPSTSTVRTTAGARWSDPSTWPKGVPGAGDVAVITERVVLDQDARVAGVRIRSGGELVFDEAASRKLESTGNVVVEGRLVMHPAAATVEHVLGFRNVRERRFVGGGMEVLPTDVGLWVMGGGALDLRGAPRRAWTRAAGAVAAATTTVGLDDDPTGWRPGDQVVLTPTLSPATDDAVVAYDLAEVKAVSGRELSLSQPTRFAHPAVKVDRSTRAAEVLNLTRNVRIEGAPGGRAHIFVLSSRPQSLQNVAIRHMGPRQPADGFTEAVLGRYGLHFHMSGDGSRGSVVENVVIRDTGAHAFVAHLSNGVTFRNCISHDTFDDPYWWDGAPDTRTPGPPSHDIVYDRCVASMVQSDPPFRGYRLAGFFLGRGDGNKAVGCVAVGVQGTTDAAGYIWPEGSEGIWKFEDCVAHNNATHGIFTWQNTGKLHVISRFTAYHNGEAGISHGAYGNAYVYQDSVLYGNRSAAVIVHASADVGPSRPLRFVNLKCDGAGLSDYLIVAVQHVAEPHTPTRIIGCSFRRARKAALGWTYDGSEGPSQIELFDVVNCSFDGNEFWLSDGIEPGSRIRVQDARLGSLLLQRADQGGRLRSDWNARVQPIAPFS
jgi:G8 domain